MFGEQDSRGENSSLHPSTSSFFENFKIHILESHFFFQTNTIIFMWGTHATIFFSKYHVFWEIQKDKFLTNNMYFGSINYQIFYFFYSQK
jgi:hypothetical protein